MIVGLRHPVPDSGSTQITASVGVATPDSATTRAQQTNNLVWPYNNAGCNLAQALSRRDAFWQGVERRRWQRPLGGLHSRNASTGASIIPFGSCQAQHRMKGGACLAGRGGRSEKPPAECSSDETPWPDSQHHEFKTACIPEKAWQVPQNLYRRTHNNSAKTWKRPSKCQIEPSDQPYASFASSNLEAFTRGRDRGREGQREGGR